VGYGGGGGGAQPPVVLGPSPLANQPVGPQGYVVVPPASQIPITNGHPAYNNPKLAPPNASGKQTSAVAYADECRIPGCGHPVFVDEDGNNSEYCSLKHRE
jgi:hypothetical protein